MCGQAWGWDLVGPDGALVVRGFVGGEVDARARAAGAQLQSPLIPGRCHCPPAL